MPPPPALPFLLGPLLPSLFLPSPSSHYRQPLPPSRILPLLSAPSLPALPCPPAPSHHVKHVAVLIRDVLKQQLREEGGGKEKGH